MQEVDELIFRDLRDIGCKIPEDYKSAKDFKADVLVACVLRCLKIVDKEKDYPRQLAKDKVKKTNQTTQLALRIMELGFKSDKDLSYHSLLYPNEIDTRKLFMWFQELLPKQDERPSADDRKSIVNRAIEEEINFLVGEKNLWVPTFVNAPAKRNQNFWSTSTLRTRELYSPSTPVYFKGFQRKTPELEKYFDDYLPFVTEQPARPIDLPPSVFEYNLSAWSDQKERENEWNSEGLESGLNPMQFMNNKKQVIQDKMASALRHSLAHGSIFKRQSRPTQRADTALMRGARLRDAGENTGESKEEAEKRREAERAEAEARYKALVEEVKDTQNKIDNYMGEIRQIKAAIQVEKDKTAELKKKYLQLKTVMDLLPDAKNNIDKLKKLAQENSEKLKNFALKWEEHRVPLVEKYRVARDKVHDREQEAKNQLEKIKEMRKKMAEMIEEINKKEEKYKQLLELYKKLPKDNRSNYTRRILEMVKNVKKQVVEINKILIDTKNLQKEINSVTETLNRSFAVAEEMIFKDAKQGDQSAGTAYKKLAAMNENFNKLVETIEQTGGSRNDILTLEEKIAKIAARTSTLNMESIETDLKQVKEENAKLIAQLKQLQQEKE